MPNVVVGVSLLLVVLQLRGETTGDVATLVALPLVALLAFIADRRYFPAILLLCLPALGIIGGRDAGGVTPSLLNPFVFPRASTFAVLAGVEVAAPLALLAGAFARVVLEMLRGGPAFRGVVPLWAVTAFLLALVPVLMGGLQGQALGYNRWSQGVRAMLVVSGFLWGVIVARRADGVAARRLGVQLTGLSVVGAALMSAGLLRGMLLFVAVGLAGGVMPYFISRRRFLEAILCGIAATVAAVAMTLTTAGSVVLALGCVALSAPHARALGRWLLRVGIFAAVVLSGLMIWAVVQLRDKTLLEVATREEGVLAYSIFKLMGDRGPLWLAAVEQITGGPYFIVPGGRPLRPENFDYGGLVYTWEFGAHNSVLELLRNTGLLGGAAALVLIGFAVLSAVRLLVGTRDDALRGVAAGFLGVAIVGMTTGNYPVYDEGFFIWAVGGMLAGAALYAPRRDQAGPAPGAAAP
ncbi:MAG TPA: hypothetical protein VLK84_23535 [Longimicrobium sp.]|nr:hypothetical protein [Longimicrobium sp.]